VQRRRIVLLGLLAVPGVALHAQPAARSGSAGLGHRSYLDVGGLASYQSDFAEALRRGAAIIDKVLRGAKPAEIPFEKATRLGLVFNLKAPKALGIVVPASLLLSADEVIG